VTIYDKLKPGFMAPKGELEKKPPHGAPCNGCGLCCKAVLCPLAERVFGRGDQGPCPALTAENRCGMVEEPLKWRRAQTWKHGEEKMRGAALLLVGAGNGCDALFNGEPADEAFRLKLRQTERETRAQTGKARKLWEV
jgi:hypothetical protein